MSAAVLTGCGSTEEEPRGLAALAPPDVPLYAEATIRPEGAQADAISSLVERVAGSTAPLDQIVPALDASLADSDTGLTYADDIEPWLGEHASIFVRSFEPAAPGGLPDMAVEFEVSDTGAAASFLQDAVDAAPGDSEERSYKSHDYFYSPRQELAAGIVGDALVLGTENSFKLAVDAADGESLATSDEYVARTQELPTDALATVFFDTGPVIEAIAAAQPGRNPAARMWKPLLAGPLVSPVAAALEVDDASASIDLSTVASSADGMDDDSAALGDLPAGAWLAAAVPGLGPLLSEAADDLAKSGLPGARMLQDRLRRATGLDLRDDILSWLDGAAGFIEGTSEADLRMGLVVGTDDPEAPRALVETLRRLIERDSGLSTGPPPEGAAYGFTLAQGPIPVVEVGEVDDRLVGAFRTTIDDVLEPDSRLADDDGYQRALDALGDFTPLLFARFPSLLDVAELGGAADDPDYRLARPYLDALEYLIIGTRVEDEAAVSRLTIGVAP